MKPIPFNEANKVLTAPVQGATTEGTAHKIDPLHVFTDGQMCISCWQPTWRERLKILFSGKVWLFIISGSTQPPVAVVSDSPFKPITQSEPTEAK